MCTLFQVLDTELQAVWNFHVGLALHVLSFSKKDFCGVIIVTSMENTAGNLTSIYEITNTGILCNFMYIDKYKGLVFKMSVAGRVWTLYNVLTCNENIFLFRYNSVNSTANMLNLTKLLATGVSQDSLWERVITFCDRILSMEIQNIGYVFTYNSNNNSANLYTLGSDFSSLVKIWYFLTICVSFF